MDIKHLKTFVTVYHAQSLSKAAALLGYAQPTVTMHIQILESDLQTETLIVTEKNCLYRNMIDEVLTAENIQPHATIATNNVQAIKELVISGVGVTILPHSTLDYEVKNNLLTKIPLQGLTPTVSTQIAYHKDKWLSPVLVRFLEEARQLYKK